MPAGEGKCVRKGSGFEWEALGIHLRSDWYASLDINILVSSLNEGPKRKKVTYYNVWYFSSKIRFLDCNSTTVPRRVWTSWSSNWTLEGIWAGCRCRSGYAPWCGARRDKDCKIAHWRKYLNDTPPIYLQDHWLLKNLLICRARHLKKTE